MSVNWDDWADLLSLGRAFGWKPAGMIRNPDPGDPFTLLGRPETDDTEIIPSARFDRYISNDGNMVTAADANAWADALENALGHPEQPTVARFLGRAYTKSELEGPDKDTFESRNATLSFARKFIEYCRTGRFIVW